MNQQPTIIFHFTRKFKWDLAQLVGFYTVESLDSEGFIHCSKEEQIIGAANRFAAKQLDLVLLVIDTQQLKSPLRFENTTGGTELFPHLYGRLNLEAVIDILPFSPNEEGIFDEASLEVLG